MTHVPHGASSTAVLDQVPAGWGALLEHDPAASPAHRPGLWQAIAAAIPAFEWRLLVSYEGGELEAGAPVMIERRGPFRWLHALPWLLPGAPVARPGAHALADTKLAAAFAGLAREHGAVGGSWSFYRPGAPAPDAGALEQLPGETRSFEAALLPLAGGLAAVRARMGRKQRQSLDQSLEWPYEFGEDPGALDAAYALHLAQSAQWSGHRPLPLELSRRLLQPSDSPVARLFTLRSPEGVVSATLALDGPHETFVWWSGTHPSARRRGAFTRLLWGVAEWAAARGRLRLNLGASSGLPHVAAFKLSLGAEGERYAVRWLGAEHASAAGRLLARAQAWRRRGRPRGERA
jgi:GNAT superfamily N-acetyltransferase